jgi:CheY-like chemotaxis protein
MMESLAPGRRIVLAMMLTTDRVERGQSAIRTMVRAWPKGAVSYGPMRGLARMTSRQTQSRFTDMSSGNAAAQPRAPKIDPQPWRWNHPRVLVEEPDEAAGLAIASALRFAGYSVAVCPGPRGHGQCPLTGPAGCAPAHDADLVVCSLGYEHEVAREVLRELRTRYPEIPLLVKVPSEMDAELRELLNGCHRLPAGASAEQVVAAVQNLYGHTSEGDPADA